MFYYVNLWRKQNKSNATIGLIYATFDTLFKNLFDATLKARPHYSVIYSAT